MIYFLQPTDGGPVKIGVSDDVAERHRALEGYYGRPLILLATMPGGREEEAAIHDRFAHLRLGRTEQFRPAADLMEFVGKPLLVNPDPSAVEAMTPSERRKLVGFTMKASPEWSDWAQRGAEKAGVSLASAIDQALRPYFKKHGFEEPPPKR